LTRARTALPLALGILAMARVAAGSESTDIASQSSSGSRLDVVVIETSPYPDIGVPLDQVPGNVQRLRAGDMGASRALDASDALNRLAGSVTVNDTQGNPFQPDVSFRGFTASPALGTPQGLSVFVDGVRVNEAFGDTVNWDLIPRSAISRLDVIPGSNPIFGLNTLGGALAVTTKRGSDYPATSIVGYGGSYGRRALELESGARGERFDVFVAGNALDDDGWADHNPGSIRQGFGKVGYRHSDTDVTLSITADRNRLEGNQTLPLSWLNDSTQAYTWPDIQENHLAFLDLNARQGLGAHLVLAAVGYYRELHTDTVNSNVNDAFLPSEPVGSGNQPTYNAIDRTGQYQQGAALQLTHDRQFGEHRNIATVGVTYDHSDTSFLQWYQEAGTRRDTRSDAVPTLTTLLQASTAAAGLYATDNLGLTARTYLTLSARYNDAQVHLDDQLGTALDGRHSFARLNPAIGFTTNPTPAMTLYANYNEGMRIPTPVELTCADPSAPCSLPNAFSADPPLKPVVSRTYEIGAHGELAQYAHFALALFRTTLNDDIQFISSGAGSISSGYFQNVGQTRRQGVELGADATFRDLRVNVDYSYIQATFLSPLILNSPNNSSAAPISCANCAQILAAPGDRGPGSPAHVGKVRVEYTPTPRASLGMNIIAQSKQYARGDENNADANGPVPGFVLVHLDGSYKLASHWVLFAHADNVFDRRYSTFGVLGKNEFTGPNQTFDPTGSTWRSEQFRSVGTRRGVWIGLRFSTGSTSGD